MTKLHQILDPDALAAQAAAGYIRMQSHPQRPNLAIYNYTEKAQFDRAWTPETLTCRGLIVDRASGEVLARPFPKFFNHDEPEAAGIDFAEPVTVTEKLDGSMGVLYWDGDDWAIATRGSFASEQAVHATRLWRERYAGWMPPIGWTLIFEIVFPENRIVVDYGQVDDLFLLGAVEIATGKTIPPESVTLWDGPRAKTYEFGSFAEALSAEPRDNAEGYVIHFRESDSRLKLKFEAYKNLHRIITGWNERTIWELLRDGKTVSDIAENLPDEFHAWATEVADWLEERHADLTAAAVFEFNETIDSMPDGYTRRDFALRAKDSEYRSALFLLLDDNHAKLDDWVWDRIRPSAVKEASLVG